MVVTIRALRDMEKRLREAVAAGKVKEAMLALEELRENKINVTFSLEQPVPQVRPSLYLPELPPVAFDTYSPTVSSGIQPGHPNMFQTLQPTYYANPS